MIARTRTAELAALVDRPASRERRGSRPRCVLLTHGCAWREVVLSARPAGATYLTN